VRDDVGEHHGSRGRRGQRYSAAAARRSAFRVTLLTGSSAVQRRACSKATKSAFTGLHFNVETEAFEFYSQTKMAGDPTWVQVTELSRKGLLRTGFDKEG